MAILITGTAGFIGYHLSNRLIAEGFDVVGLDCINEYYDVNLKYARLKTAGINKEEIKYNKLVQSDIHSNYRFIQCKLEDKESIDSLFESQKFEIVVNLAAQAGVRYSLTNPYTYLSSNIDGFLNILEACRHNPVKHLVYASSSSVYGLNTDIPFSVKDNTDHPISLYAASKKSNELMAHTYSHLYNIPTTGLRFFTVYGPWGRPDMALFIFTKAIMENKPFEVFNNGDMSRDFTYIDDIVEGITRLMKKPPVKNPNYNHSDPNAAKSSSPYQVFNIGNNGPISLMEFIEAIEKATGKEGIKDFQPIQAGDVPRTYADVEDLFNYVNFRPGTPVEKGIQNFIDWYTDFYTVS